MIEINVMRQIGVKVITSLKVIRIYLTNSSFPAHHDTNNFEKCFQRDDEYDFRCTSRGKSIKAHTMYTAKMKEDSINELFNKASLKYYETYRKFLLNTPQSRHEKDVQYFFNTIIPLYHLLPYYNILLREPKVSLEIT